MSQNRLSEILAKKKQSEPTIKPTPIESKLSLADRLALKKNQAELKEARGEAVDPTIPKPLLSDTKKQPNVLKEVKESLADRLARKRAEQSSKLQKQIEEYVEQEHQPTALQAEKEAERLEETKEVTKAINSTDSTDSTEVTEAPTEQFASDVEYNSQQLAAIEMVKTGKSFCLIGGPGTGKSTTSRGIVKAILDLNEHNMESIKFKAADNTVVETLPIAITAYTRRASANVERAIFADKELKEKIPYNVVTLHKLLEYEPTTYLAYNEEGEEVERFAFRPQRTEDRPLLIDYLVIDEPTLVSLDLWDKVYQAMKAGTQIIFIGDLNQIQAVFGDSVLVHALLQLPSIELTKVYRQVGDSPIIHNAIRVSQGLPIESMKNESGELKVIQPKTDVRLSQHKLSTIFASMMETLYKDGRYNPQEDMILSPYNVKDCGTKNINNHIAEILGKDIEAEVYEIIAGFEKRYLAVGDKVIVNKRDAIITRITSNPAYVGRATKLPCKTLSRFGHYRAGETSPHQIDFDEEASDYEMLDYSNMDVDSLIEEEGRVLQSSHKVTVSFSEGEDSILTSAKDLSSEAFSLGYALTGHKAQGSEWNNVFIIVHEEHMKSMNREWLFTCITRARKNVYILSRQYLLDKAITRQQVKGDTLAEKIETFKHVLETRKAKDPSTITKVLITKESE